MSSDKCSADPVRLQSFSFWLRGASDALRADVDSCLSALRIFRRTCSWVDASDVRVFDHLQAAVDYVQRIGLWIGDIAEAFREAGGQTMSARGLFAVLLSTHQNWLLPGQVDLVEAERMRFVSNVMDAYGFDYETAAIIVKAYEGIEKRFPDKTPAEQAHLFNLLMGSFTYDGAAWDVTAGSWHDYFADQDFVLEGISFMPGLGSSIGATPKFNRGWAFEQLGLSSVEYRKLEYTIDIQNRFAGASVIWSADDMRRAVRGIDIGEDTDTQNKMAEKYNEELISAREVYGADLSEDEFVAIWDRNRASFLGKADFAHQSITTASLLLGSDLTVVNGWSGEKVSELAGWRGDATGVWVLEKDPSLGADDYKADIDAVNLDSMIDKHLSVSYKELLMDYNEHVSLWSDEGKNNNNELNVANSAWNRVDLFNKSVGGDEKAQGIDYVIQELCEAAGVEVGDLQALQKKNPAGYRFVWNLQQRNNELKTP